MARSTASILKQIEKTKNRLAKQRDELRELIDELESIEGSCVEAVQSLESAADSLSQYL